MANLEYDDFDDVGGSEEGDVFNEDELDDKEYNELYHYLPQLKTKISSYNDNIPEIDLKEALYYNYFELDKAIEELKSQFPKKKPKSSRKYIFFFFFSPLKKSFLHVPVLGSNSLSDSFKQYSNNIVDTKFDLSIEKIIEAWVR